MRLINCSQTHPMLPAHWYRTPLEFIGHDRFGIDIHWSYYTRLAQLFHIHLFSRPVTSRPWDRFPSDTWLCPDLTYTPIPICILLGFSCLFLLAWDFYFPTYTEKVLWRICSVYHAIFSIYGGIYYFIEIIQSRRRSTHRHRRLRSSNTLSMRQKPEGSGIESPNGLFGCLPKWRKVFADYDPEMGVSFRILLPVTLMCFLYIFARGYIYVEDFISLRVQPSDVYIGVDETIPFLG